MKFHEAVKIATTYNGYAPMWENFIRIINEGKQNLIWNKRRYPIQVRAINFLLRKRTRKKFLAWLKLQQ